MPINSVESFREIEKAHKQFSSFSNNRCIKSFKNKYVIRCSIALPENAVQFV